MRSPIETKVALPALLVGGALVVVPELYGLLKAYDVLSPDQTQNLAIIKVGAALAYLLHVYTGYKAPHTSRPDLAAAGAEPTGKTRKVITPRTHRAQVLDVEVEPGSERIDDGPPAAHLTRRRPVPDAAGTGLRHAMLRRAR